MTNRPDDQIDPYESRLTRHVGAFAEQAVRPIDATAIAATAAAAARRRTIAGRLFGSTASTARLVVVLAGAVFATALGAVIAAGGLNGPGPTQTTAAVGPEATPTSVPGAVDVCAPDVLTGEITAWEGAAGHRIATINLRNTGARDCVVQAQLRLSLFDSADHELIYGFPCDACPPFTFGAGNVATALVDMSNFCSMYSPSGTLRIRVHLPDGGSVDLLPTANLHVPIDPPPCSGPSQPGSIGMQPLRLAP